MCGRPPHAIAAHIAARGGCCVLCSRVAGGAATSYAYLAQLAQFSDLRSHLLDPYSIYRGLDGRHTLVGRKKCPIWPFVRSAVHAAASPFGRFIIDRCS